MYSRFFAKKKIAHLGEEFNDDPRNFDFLKVFDCHIHGDKLNQVNTLLVCKRGHSFPSIDGIPLFYVSIIDLEQFEMHERVKLEKIYYVTSPMDETMYVANDKSHTLSVSNCEGRRT